MTKLQLPHWQTSDSARANPIALCPAGKSPLQKERKAAKASTLSATPAFSALPTAVLLKRVASTGSVQTFGFPLCKAVRTQIPRPEVPIEEGQTG